MLQLSIIVVMFTGLSVRRRKACINEDVFIHDLHLSVEFGPFEIGFLRVWRGQCSPFPDGAKRVCHRVFRG